MRPRGGLLTKGVTVMALAAGASAAVGSGEKIFDTPEAFAEGTGGYPDADKPCVAIGDPQYGETTGTGYWCNGYQWGDSPNAQNSGRGYGYRNCTDWAAYRANQLTGIAIPNNLGNAHDWDNNAPTAWTKDNVPEPGDIAQAEIPAGGEYGHVGVVESVSKDSNGVITSISVSEYNKGQDGNYSINSYTPDANGEFWRGPGKKWDNFIDVNGTGLGINDEVLSSGASPASTPIVRVPVVANFDGIHGEDLLASVKRSDGAPNLYAFPSLGGWLGGSALWSAPGQINWSEARLSAGDMNGDGKSDLFAIQQQADKHPNIYLLRSQGSSFAAPLLMGVPDLWFNDVKEWVSGDYNGDGYDDLLAVSRRSDAAPNLVVFPSQGGWLGTSNLWGAPGELNWEDVKVVPADVDNDGKTDLLSIQPDAADRPNIYWSRSTGSSFAPPQLVGVPGLNFDNINNWVAGNFDGVQGTDLLASSKRSDSAPNLLVFPSLSGWLGGNSLWGAPGQINWANARMVPADVNGDGKTDLLSIQSNGTNPTIYWSRSLGSSFATPQLVGVPGMVPGNVRWQS